MAEEHLDPYHLPRNVIPSRYDLTLQPDVEQATFTGSVIIALEVVEPTDAIWLNAAELEILSTALEDADGSHVCSPEAELLADQERLRLGLGASLPPGGYRLMLGFEGILNDKLRGFYLSKFKDDDGNEHRIATTQFESTDARRAFPCFDEPDFKAVFGITLIVPDDLYNRLQCPYRLRNTCRQRLAPGVLRRHHENVHLSGGLHRRPLRGHRGGGR